jgi:hypothetical protein
MYILYVDESGDPGIGKGSQFLNLTGCAVFEGQWWRIDSNLKDLISRYFAAPLNPPSEIHAVDLFHRQNECRQLTAATRQALLSDYQGLITSFLPVEIKFFSIICDKNYWFRANPGKKGNDLYIALFEDLSSRFDLFLRRQYVSGQPNKGIVIVDHSKAALSQALLAFHKHQRKAGNRWAGNIHNIIETVFFLSSHESPGLQFADYASYAMWRFINSNDDSLIRNIAPFYDREPLGSTTNPGKWHGVKYYGTDRTIITRISTMWAP